MNTDKMKGSKSFRKKQDRRQILNMGIAAGVGLTLGGIGGAVIKAYGKEKVRLITADGKVFEIEKRHLPRALKGKLSNEELSQWMAGS